MFKKVPYFVLPSVLLRHAER